MIGSDLEFYSSILKSDLKKCSLCIIECQCDIKGDCRKKTKFIGILYSCSVKLQYFAQVDLGC